MLGPGGFPDDAGSQLSQGKTFTGTGLANYDQVGCFLQCFCQAEGGAPVKGSQFRLIGCVRQRPIGDIFAGGRLISYWRYQPGANRRDRNTNFIQGKKRRAKMPALGHAQDVIAQADFIAC